MGFRVQGFGFRMPVQIPGLKSQGWGSKSGFWGPRAQFRLRSRRPGVKARAEFQGPEVCI